jgi:predicted permease
MLQDLRYAIRSILTRPLVTSVAVLSLALGIGVNTAIFSVFDRMLLRRLPVPAPDGIVLVTSPGPRPGSNSTGDAGGPDAIFSYPLFRDLEQLRTGGLRMAAHRDFTANLAYQGQTSEGEGVLVSGEYFPALGVRPAVGRLFGPEDDRATGGHPLVVLSYDYWKTRFAADPAVIDKELVVNGEPMTIVGVAPPGFSGNTLMDRPHVFVPLAMAQRALRDPDAGRLTARNNRWLYVFGRLEPGVTREQAQSLINVPFSALVRDVEYPALRSGLRDRERPPFQQRQLVLDDGARPRTRDRTQVQSILLLMIAITAFVLAIACANVANLLLARAIDRVRELSVRISLGASAGRVIRLLLIEASVLGVLGGAAALAVAWVTLRGLLAIMPAEDNVMLNFGIDTTVLTFTLVLGLVTSVLFGLFPALHAMRTAMTTGIQIHSNRTSGSRAANRFRASMATTQVALATALLAVAGLFVVSLVNIGRQELGIRREGLVTFRLAPYLNGYTAERSRALFEQLESELRALPGVVSVTASTVPVLADSNWTNNVTVEGFEAGPDSNTSASHAQTGTDYFRTLGIPVLAGREFTTADSKGSARVAIVNEAFARQFNLGSRAVGTRMALGAGSNKPLDIEIVGLVRDAKYSQVREAPPAQFVIPYRQTDPAVLTFYVRTGSDTRPIVGIVPSVVGRIDADLPITHLRTMDDQIWDNTTRDRVLTTLSSSFAALALVLAGIGLYAVLAYGVAQRLREIGIRIALGAKAADVRRLVFSQVGGISLIGGIIGAGLALALGRLGQAMFFGVQGYDLSIIGAAVLLILAVVFAAGAVPARRASLVDPVTVLKAE